MHGAYVSHSLRELSAITLATCRLCSCTYAGVPHLWLLRVRTAFPVEHSIHPVFLLIAASVFAPPLLALGPVIFSGVHRLVASGTILVIFILAAIVTPGSGS